MPSAGLLCTASLNLKKNQLRSSQLKIAFQCGGLVISVSWTVSDKHFIVGHTFVASTVLCTVLDLFNKSEVHGEANSSFEVTLRTVPNRSILPGLQLSYSK